MVRLVADLHDTVIAPIVDLYESYVEPVVDEVVQRVATIVEQGLGGIVVSAVNVFDLMTTPIQDGETIASRFWFATQIFDLVRDAEVFGIEAASVAAARGRCGGRTVPARPCGPAQRDAPPRSSSHRST